MPSDTPKQNECFSNVDDKWETATTTTVTAPRSQRSTLHREQPVTRPPPTSKVRRKPNDELSFRSHEKYFEHKMYVFGHRYSSTRELMWRGDHSFPFSYTLPTKLPSSFHGRFGYVRYFCEVSLERHGQPTMQRRVFFSVSTIMDLNTDSKADAGVSKEKKSNSWCFCCPSGTIIASAKIRKRGFVPGEMIPIHAYVFNVSNKPVQTITARIIQMATYFSSKGFQKKTDETIVVEKSEGTLPPGESTLWEEVGPCVPPCSPSSTMIDCKLITIDYRLEFVLDIYKAKEPMILRMPLRIGTIPLEKVFKNLLDNVAAADYYDTRSPLPTSICNKYPKLPATFAFKCVKGDRHVNRYYFRQIPRSMNSMLGISSRQPVQPVITDEEEVFAPRYLSYIMCPEKMACFGHAVDENKMKVLNEEPKVLQNGNVGVQNHLLINVSPSKLHHPHSVTTTPVLSDGSRIASTICSPTSFRSYKITGTTASSFVHNIELSSRLASAGMWSDNENDGLRYRNNIASDVANDVVLSCVDSTKENKKDK